MDNLPEIVQSIIDQIDLNLKVDRVEVDKLFVCETTLHLTIGKIILIDGKEYNIVDFDLNKWVQVEPLGHSDPVPLDTTVLAAPKITFLHGDPKSTDAEYLEVSTRTRMKTPFIWLSTYEFEDLPRDSSLDLSFEARFFFLDEAGENSWNNDKHNKRATKPMHNLLKAFVKVIEKDFNFKTMASVRGVVRPRFGVTVKGESPKEKIINEDLSGIDAKMKIEIYDESSCLCN